MPRPGQILFYRDYPFSNGSKKDKLFVVLNDTDSDARCLVLKTTSQSRHYARATQGCNPQQRVFFIPVSWDQCFRQDTYIALPQIIEIPIQKLVLLGVSRDIYVSTSLSLGRFKLLKSCLKGFKADISPEHWRMVFGSKERKAVSRPI